MKRMSRGQRIQALLRLTHRCIKLSLSGQKKVLPSAIYTSFRELGGVYVKFLQLLALQSEAFQALRSYNVYDIYDRVGFEEINIQALLNQQLGSAAQDITLESDQPFAAGSFGQVYRAQYGQKTIIIKVLRPSVVSDLSFDLRMLGMFSLLASWFSAGRALSLWHVYKGFAQTTRLETNYLLEADYASTLYERYANHPQAVIPYTYQELSTDRLICQEYIDGLAVTDLIDLVQRGGDAAEYVRTTLGSSLQDQLVSVGSEMLSSIFIYGEAYGDPHPGNIILLPNNKVGVIDFGLQAPAPKNLLQFHRLVEEYQKIYSGHPDLRSYSQVLLDMYGGDIVRAAHSLDDYMGDRSPHLIEGMLLTAERFMQVQKEETSYLLQNNKMMMLFDRVINKNNRFCLKYDVDGPEIARAGFLFIALVSSLGIKENVLERTYTSVVERTRHVPLTDVQPIMHPERAVEILANWYDQISYRNPQLYRKLKQGRLYHV